MDLLKTIQECRPDFKSVEEFKSLFEGTLKALQKTSKDFEVYGNTIDYDKYLEYENQLKVIVVLGICNSNGEKMLVDAKSLFDSYYEPFKTEQRIKFIDNACQSNITPKQLSDLEGLRLKLHRLNIKYNDKFKFQKEDIVEIIAFLSSKTTNNLFEQTVIEPPKDFIDFEGLTNMIDGRSLLNVEEYFGALNEFNLKEEAINHFVVRAFTAKDIGKHKYTIEAKRGKEFDRLMRIFYNFYKGRELLSYKNTNNGRKEYIQIFLDNFDVYRIEKKGQKRVLLKYEQYDNYFRDKKNNVK